MPDSDPLAPVAPRGANPGEIIDLNKIVDEWSRSREGTRGEIRREIREGNLQQLREQVAEYGLEGNVVIAPIRALDWIFNQSRQNSIWPMTFGLACCAIEMMAAGAPKYDLERFGLGAFRATPRQADVMIVAGTVTHKMAPRLARLYKQMPDPKFVIAMGACAIGGGPYCKHGYSIVKGVDKLVPVDVYVPGCPPRPEALIDALMKLQDKIGQDTIMTRWKQGINRCLRRKSKNS